MRREDNLAAVISKPQKLGQFRSHRCSYRDRVAVKNPIRGCVGSVAKFVVDGLFNKLDCRLNNEHGHASLGHIAAPGNDLVGFAGTTWGRTTVNAQLSFPRY